MADEGQAEFAVADELGFVYCTGSRGYGRVADKLSERARTAPERTVLQATLDHQLIRIAVLIRLGPKQWAHCQTHFSSTHPIVGCESLDHGYNRHI